jgi:hypothetical protein
MKVLLPLLASLLAFGCASAPPDTSSTTKEEPVVEAPPTVTKSEIFDQLHSGLFQADAAVKKIGDALDIARDVQSKVTPDLVDALKDMVATLDDAGAGLADATGGDAPTEAEVKADEGTYKSMRDRLVVLIDDTLKNIREQVGVAADLAENGPEITKKSCAKIDLLLNQVIDDLVGALEGLGAD